jgi:hypothetical protein
VKDLRAMVIIRYIHNRLITTTCILLIPLAFSSCRHHTSMASTHVKANIDYHKLFGKLEGTWVSYEYMLNLSKTTSPSQSAAFMEGVFSFSIDSDGLRNDTVHCRAWINGHVERDLWIAFDSPDSIGQYSIGINLARNSDNEPQGQAADNITRIKIDSPFLTIYTSTFDSVRYVFYEDLPRNSSADYAIRHYTTAALFRGEYYTNDSDMIFGASRIYFDPKEIGRIEGSPIYDSFDINVNLLTQSDSVNYMELFDSRKQYESRSYIYSIKKNILHIYPSMDSVPCTLHKVQPEDTLMRP